MGDKPERKIKSVKKCEQGIIRYLRPSTCPDCGQNKKYTSKRCMKCFNKTKIKVNREKLTELILQGYADKEIAKIMRASYHTIVKARLSLGLKKRYVLV